MTDSLQVCELFYSIQGESTWSGYPCAFIRLSGCNLRCTYCDASYTWKEAGTEMRTKDIMHWLQGYPGSLVEFTGGEPLLQENVHPLIEQITNSGHKVLLETNGSIALEDVHRDVSVIMDIKCPGSGMEEKTSWQNLELLKRRKEQGSRDEIKFVLSSEEDFHWAFETVREYGLQRLVPLLFSPVTASFKPDHLAELILGHQLPVRLQLQLHTLLWPDKSRGV